MPRQQKNLHLINGPSRTPTNELVKPWHCPEYPILVPSMPPSKLQDARYHDL